MSVKLSLKVIPKASRDEIAGTLGDLLKVRVCAPPERGKANKAVEKLLAESLGISLQSVRVVAGKTTARKTVEIEGMSEEDVCEQLNRLISK